MTLNEAINRIDSVMPNAYTDEEKIDWISRLDAMVLKQVYDKYNDTEEFVPYGADRDIELLVPYPFDSIYIDWLKTQIALAENETANYNNFAMVFNDSFAEFRNYYNSTHMPKGSHIKYW